LVVTNGQKRGWQQGIWKVRFSPDGRKVVTAHKNERGSVSFACVWDTASRKMVTGRLEHPGLINDVAFSPDGRLIATACDDNNARLWSVETGLQATPPLGHFAPVWRTLFSPDGKILLTFGGDGVARLWKTSSGMAMVEPLHPEARLAECCFDSSGRRVATASVDGATRVWDAATGEPLTPGLRHAGEAYSVQFSPDGRWLLTAGEDQTARLWNQPNEHHSVADLIALVGVLSGGPLPDKDVMPLEAAWSHLCKAYPEEFGLNLARIIKPGVTETRFALDTALFHAHGAEVQENWNSTVFQLSRVLEIQPDRWEALFRRGHAQMQLSNWAAAGADFFAAINVRSNSTVTWLERALARSRLGDPRDAWNDLQRAIEVAPHFRHPLLSHPLTPADVDPSTDDQWERVRADCLMLLQTNPNNAVALCVRGIVEGKQTQWDPAMGDFQEVARLQSNDALGWLLRAMAIGKYYGIGGPPRCWDLVCESASHAIELRPKDPRGWLLRGEAEEFLKMNEEALSDYLRALEFGLSTSGLRYTIAEVQARLGRWHEAWDNLERNLRNYPEDAKNAQRLILLLCNGLTGL
jgi:tetratricopeptide (TPR) repeat protein